MLYVVEMDFGAPERLAEWQAWYLEHVHVLLSLPGFHTAQRFVCITPWRAPWLALYSVDSAGVFESGPYHARGGRDSAGEWKPLMHSWDRNLFDGLARAPAVAPNEVLLLTEDDPVAVRDLGIAFVWLQACGLDRTVARRGLAVVDAARGARMAQAIDARVRAYRPVTPRLRAGDGLQNAGAER